MNNLTHRYHRIGYDRPSCVADRTRAHERRPAYFGRTARYHIHRSQRDDGRNVLLWGGHAHDANIALGRVSDTHEAVSLPYLPAFHFSRRISNYARNDAAVFRLATVMWVRSPTASTRNFCKSRQRLSTIPSCIFKSMRLSMRNHAVVRWLIYEGASKYRLRVRLPWPALEPASEQ